MQRISTASAVANLFGPGKNGLTDGDPVGGIPTTWLDAAWFNAVQEEIARAIELSGMALDPARRDQLYEAIGRIASGRMLANIPIDGYVSSAPGSPADGAQYIVAPAATGIWAGRVGQIARWRGAWEYETPRAGRMASYWTGLRLVTLRHDGTSWAEWLSSTDAAGPVELATPQEAAAGTDATRAVTPAGLAASRPVSTWTIDDYIAAPPSSPAEGAQYLIAANPTGAWAGRAGQLARYAGGAWQFDLPRGGREVTLWNGARQVVLHNDGAAWAEDVAYRLRNTIIQSVAGTYTYVKPAWLRYLEIEMVGGGGGGAGAGSNGGEDSYGGGGGGGGYLRKRLLASELPASSPYTVGVGGLGGYYTVGVDTATAGGSSSFGSSLLCPGGGGGGIMQSGSSPTGTRGSHGGIASGGDLNIKGGYGLQAYRFAVFVGLPGDGGDSFYSPKSLGRGLPAAGYDGVGAGGGGAGAASINSTGSYYGGNGKPGMIIIREYE